MCIRDSNKPAAKSASKEPGLGEVSPEPKAPEIVTYDKPTYYRIPLHGVVGETFVGSVLEKSLKDALDRKADAVVLEINSPGGMLLELQKIIPVIRDYNDKLRVVAWVRHNALSAAAVTALACREIYMEPGSRIGGATAFKMTILGMPKAIEEKMQAAWRAEARAVAETGGHNTLLTEAMIDNALELHLVVENGMKIIKEGTGEHMITRKGRLLVMTTGEALEYGLSSGTAGNMKELTELLGLKDAVECKGLGTLLAEHRKEVLKKIAADWKKLDEEFESNMKKAWDNNPVRFTYTYWKHNRKFTPASRRKWRERSAACSRFLLKAEKALETMVGLAKEHVFLMASAEMLEHRKKSIGELREKIRKDSWKASPDDIAG